jgi:tetratricopeptide (TPR) repeat protein
LILKARAQAKLGNYKVARADLEQWLETNLDPVVMALLGYYCNKSKLHSIAVESYKGAIHHGLRSAAVYNNLGYSYWRLDEPPYLAVDALSKAIELDDQLATPFHNRAIAWLRFAEQENAFPQSAIDDVERAIELSEANGELYRDAARIYAFASQFDTAWKSTAFRSFLLALQNNIGKGEFKASETCSFLLDQLDRMPAPVTPQRAAPIVRTEHFLDPMARSNSRLAKASQ